jgi:hypothetical protein
MAQTTPFETWKYRDSSLATSLTQQEIRGYDVEALDGGIGKMTTTRSRPISGTSSSTRDRGSSARRSCSRPASSRPSTTLTRRSS